MRNKKATGDDDVPEDVLKLFGEGGLKNNDEIDQQVLDRTMWRARFGRGFGPVVRQTTKLNEIREKLTEYLKKLHEKPRDLHSPYS
jgi:hypothetical protein